MHVPNMGIAPANLLHGYIVEDWDESVSLNVTHKNPLEKRLHLPWTAKTNCHWKIFIATFIKQPISYDQVASIADKSMHK